MTAETTRLPAVGAPQPLTPSIGGTGSRTGGLKAQGSAQAGEYTPAELVSRILVLPWGTRHNREHIREVAVHIDDTLRPVHYREVSVSLERLGHHEAARAVRSAAKDLENTE